jgi:hypothetical protein
MDGDPAARLRGALELHELGVQMQRQRLIREWPELPEADVDGLLRAWLHDRPGAEHGDTAGIPAQRPP